MALPKLNDVPKYEVTVPSTGEQTFFRPYLVREEKVLLIASESGDETSISKATIDLINACVDTELKNSNITTFDIEYLFCKIRAKSVGETSKMKMMCLSEECTHESDLDIRLEDVELTQHEKISNLIQLTDAVTIEMRYPSFNVTLNNKYIQEAESEAEIMYHTVISCIKSIMTEDERISADDENYDDLVEFVNEMTTEQFEKMKQFILNSPEVQLPINWKCEECGHENAFELKGLADFF